MASGRVRSGSFCFAIHVAMAADCSGRTRRWTDSAPVDGLPLDFRVRVIDLPMNIVYQKKQAGAKAGTNAPALTPNMRYTHVEG